MNLFLRYLIISVATTISLIAEDMMLLEVVTGTRTTKLLSDAPIKTELVTSKQIENTHSDNVGEAIKHITGLVLRETHGKEGMSVSMQGFSSDRVLVLIDGIPMTSSMGQTVDLSQLDASDIKSIEVLKGAASALYGSQAMGGVINIITKGAKKGLHSKVSVKMGTFGDKKATSMPESVVKLSASYRDDDYQALFFTDYRYDSGVKLEDGYEYHISSRDRVNIAAEFRTLGSTEFYIKPKFYIEESEKPFSTFIPGIGNIEELRTEEVQKYRLTMGSKSKFDDGDKLITSIFAERYISDSYQDKIDTSYVESSRSAVIDMAQADVQYDTIFSDTHLVTTGILLKHQRLKQSTTKHTNISVDKVNEIVGDATISSYESYVQDDWFITDNFELIAGVRYQNDSDFGNYISPKLALFYTPYEKNKAQLNIRASYGNGYKIPSLKERFFKFDQSQAGIMLLGNSDLVPESSTSYQLSFEWIEKKSYTIGLNLYYNDIEELISLEKSIPKSEEMGLRIYEYTNINKALTKGFELDAKVKFLDNYTFSVGYTYLDAKNTDTKLVLAHKPKNQVKTTLSYDTKRTNISLSAIYESEEFVDKENEHTSPSSTQVDIKMTQHVTKLFSIFGGVTNLLDDYQEISDDYDERTKRARFIYIGASYKL